MDDTSVPNQGDSLSTEAAVDWRVKLPPDSRQKMFKQIISTLKHLPSSRHDVHDLKDIAMRFEERCYTTATSQLDYMKKISLKLMAIQKTTLANPVPSSLPSNAAVNPSDPGSQGMQQVNNQGQPPPILVPSNHPQATKQSINSDVASPGVQDYAGVSSTLPPGSGISQLTMPNIPGQNSSLQNIQNISGIPQNGVGKSMGHGVSPNKFVSQRQIPGRQHPPPQQQQQLQNLQHFQPQLQQNVKQQPQQNNSTTSMLSHIQQQHQNMLHSGHFQASQQSVLQPSMLQPSSLSTGRQNQSAQPVIQNHLQSVLRQQRQQQAQSSPMGHQTSSANLHLNKLIGQSGSFSELQQQQHPRLMGQQKNILSSQQHSVGQHNNFSIHRLHMGSQSSSVGQQRQQNQLHGDPTMLNNQQSSLLLQSKVAAPQQNQPAQGQRSQLELKQQVVPQTQSGQLPHQLTMKLKPNMLQRDMQSIVFQQKNADQQKLSQQQRAMPEASTSSDSTAQTGNPNAGDRQEAVYQKLQIMKDKYMPLMKDLYQKFKGRLQHYDSLSPKPTGEQVERMKQFIKQLEHCMRIMLVSKNKISPDFIEKVDAFEKQILQLINTQKQKPGVTLQQPHTAPHMNSLYQSHQTKGHLTQMQPHTNQINTQMQPVNLQHNNMVSLQHNAVSSLPLVSSAQQNMMGMLQPNTNMIPHQQLKQTQSRQMPQQLLYKQPPLHQQKFHQQNGRLQVNQLPQLNHNNDGNDLKIRHQTRVMSDTLHQHFRAPFPPQIDQQNMLTSVTKFGTPSQSVNSPFIVSSPSTPSTSHMLGDSEKADSGAPPRSIAGNIGNQKSLAIATPDISASPLLSELTSPDGNHGNGASVLAQNSTTVEDPMERLLKVVNSISPKSLSASVSKIDTAIDMMDSIAGAAPSNVSRVEVDEDLVSMAIDHLQESAIVTQDGSAINMMDSIDEDLVAIIKDYLQESAFLTQDGTTGTRKMKRRSANESFMQLNCLEASQMESTGTHTIKRPRMERNHALLEEIKIINQGLIDTVVDISERDADPPAVSELGEGTIVKCSYCPVALGPHLKLQYASQMSPIQPLQLLVPANYPNCSPVLLDKIPVEGGNEYKDLSIKAKWRFSSSRTWQRPLEFGSRFRKLYVRNT